MFIRKLCIANFQKSSSKISFLTRKYNQLHLAEDVQMYSGSRILYTGDFCDENMGLISSKLRLYSDNPVISAIFLSSRSDDDKSLFWPKSKRSLEELKNINELIRLYSKSCYKPIISLYQGIYKLKPYFIFNFNILLIHA